MKQKFWSNKFISPNKNFEEVDFHTNRHFP